MKVVEYLEYIQFVVFNLRLDVNIKYHQRVMCHPYKLEIQVEYLNKKSYSEAFCFIHIYEDF